MKVSFQYGLAGYTGKAQGLVYYFDRRAGRVYARRNTYPRLTQENERVGSITKNLLALQPTAEYKENLSLYLMKYNSLAKNYAKPLRSWVNLFLKLMYAMAKADPGINLRTISRTYIYDHDLPCISVKKAVEAGLLPEVYDYQRYDAEM
ncbi:MAG: hypothetical protein PHO32_04210 [Candidatus Cloacimonetes bacterium]|nr:hypothetical protein [Candidatus Cloacimonadota bacterium]